MEEYRSTPLKNIANVLETHSTCARKLMLNNEDMVVIDSAIRGKEGREETVRKILEVDLVKTRDDESLKNDREHYALRKTNESLCQSVDDSALFKNFVTDSVALPVLANAKRDINKEDTVPEEFVNTKIKRCMGENFVMSNVEHSTEGNDSRDSNCTYEGYVQVCTPLIIHTNSENVNENKEFKNVTAINRETFPAKPDLRTADGSDIIENNHQEIKTYDSHIKNETKPHLKSDTEKSVDISETSGIREFSFEKSKSTKCNEKCNENSDSSNILQNASVSEKSLENSGKTSSFSETTPICNNGEISSTSTVHINSIDVQEKSATELCDLVYAKSEKCVVNLESQENSSNLNILNDTCESLKNSGNISNLSSATIHTTEIHFDLLSTQQESAQKLNASEIQKASPVGEISNSDILHKVQEKSYELTKHVPNVSSSNSITIIKRQFDSPPTTTLNVVQIQEKPSVGQSNNSGILHASSSNEQSLQNLRNILNSPSAATVHKRRFNSPPTLQCLVKKLKFDNSSQKKIIEIDLTKDDSEGELQNSDPTSLGTKISLEGRDTKTNATAQENSALERKVIDDVTSTVPTVSQDSGMIKEDEVLNKNISGSNIHREKKDGKKSNFQNFVSNDPKENDDNNNPEWEVLKKLETDDERYKAVRKRWRNLIIPDPNKNLTCIHIKSTFKHPAFCQIDKKEQGHAITRNSRKRTFSCEPSSTVDHVSVKRARTRSCTTSYEIKVENQYKNLKEEERKLEVQMNTALANTYTYYNRAHQNLLNSNLYYYNTLEFTTRMAYLSVQRREAEAAVRRNFSGAVDKLKEETHHKVLRLHKAIKEVEAFHKFYRKLDENCVKKDCYYLTDAELEDVFQTNDLYETFEKFYNG